MGWRTGRDGELYYAPSAEEKVEALQRNNPKGLNDKAREFVEEMCKRTRFGGRLEKKERDRAHRIYDRIYPRKGEFDE